MNELVFKGQNGNLVTSSFLVAEKFSKRHADVLRALDNLECSDKFRKRNFAFAENQLIGAAKERVCIMTRDGFSFLVMGFTGKQASQFKEDFINAFNEMESTLKVQLPTTYKDALIALVAEIDAKELAESKIKELEPKAEVFDNIANADNLLSMEQTAKTLNVGRNKMMKQLREKTILQENNVPYQNQIDAGHFKVKVSVIKGLNENYVQTFVTGKGLTYLSKIIK